MGSRLQPEAFNGDKREVVLSGDLRKGRHLYRKGETVALEEDLIEAKPWIVDEEKTKALKEG